MKANRFGVGEMGLRRKANVPGSSGSCPSYFTRPSASLATQRFFTPRRFAAPLTTLLLVSRADPASVTLRDALLETAPWEDAGSFRGLPVRRHGAFLLAEVEPMHLECDGVDAALKAAGHAFDTILVCSRHRAESGKPALTVHPIGNWGAADLGGAPGRVTPSAPVAMGRVLRRLHAEAKGTRHEVTFEATHHGPLLATPTAFVEIGTDEAAWRDADLGRRVARALLAAEEPTPHDGAPVLMMVGGSHYAPRATDLVRKGKANFGHILPGHALERGVLPRTVLEAIEGTPGCQGYYLDPRLVEKRPEDVLQLFAGLDMGWWREDDLG